jgi:RNA polymerase sigma factor (sigma-70 family)
MRPHQSAQQHPRYDLDMTGLADEQLVVLVQECGYVPARDELICRCNPLKDRLIGRRAARSGLQEADRLDAQQDAVLWILEAIRKYDTGQQVVPRGCRFRTFLYHVLLSRFIDLLRRHHRGQTRLRRGGYMLGSLLGPRALQRDGTPADPAVWGGRPQRGTERGDLMARLHQELDRLDGLSRELWHLLVRGMPLREIAAALGLSYDAVKRQRRKLVAHLRACLGRAERPRAPWRRGLAQAPLPPPGDPPESEMNPHFLRPDFISRTNNM